MSDTRVHAGGRLQMPRSRGAASGFLLILLGIWGRSSRSSGRTSISRSAPTTSGRGQRRVAGSRCCPALRRPSGGFLLLSSRNRFTAMLGGWLTVFAGAGSSWGGRWPGRWVSETPVLRWRRPRPGASASELAYFYGLGALIIFLGAIALGRLSVRSARDVRYAQRAAMTATASRVASDDVTEIQPAEEDARASPPLAWAACSAAAADSPIDRVLRLLTRGGTVP